MVAPGFTRNGRFCATFRAFRDDGATLVMAFIEPRRDEPKQDQGVDEDGKFSHVSPHNES